MPETQDDDSYDAWEPNVSKRLWSHSRTIYKYKSYQLILKSHGEHRDHSWGLRVDGDIIGMLNIRHIIKLKNGLEVPQVSKSVIDSDFRSKGWGYKMYRGALRYYGLLGSDYHLHGDVKKHNGSVGIWLKLSAHHPTLVYSDDKERLYKYSKRTAFGLDKIGERSIITFQTKKMMNKILLECS